MHYRMCKYSCGDYMNIQLKFIVLAFSAFTLVSATSSSASSEVLNEDLGVRKVKQVEGKLDVLDAELAAAARKILKEEECAQRDHEQMSIIKDECVQAVNAITKTDLGVFAREFRRGFNYVFSNENVDRVSCLLTRFHKEVPYKMVVASGLLVADSVLTGFVFDKPSQAVVVSGLACYAWMNLPDFSYYTDCLSKTTSEFLTNSVSAALSRIFGGN